MDKRMRVVVIVLVMALVPTVACTLFYQYRALGGIEGWRGPILASYPLTLLALIAIAEYWPSRRQRPGRLRLAVAVLLLALGLMQAGRHWLLG